jgi:hypothetical protein
VTRALIRLAGGLALASVVACAPQPQRAASNDQSSAEGRRTGPASPQTGAPARKALLAALLANVDVPLSVHASCMAAGTAADDRTVGDYVSGFVAEFDRASRNWIETNVERASSAAGEPLWRAEVMLRHAAGDDEWGWGVRFDIRMADGRVVRESFQCVGAG